MVKSAQESKGNSIVKTVILWFILLVVCWPIALLVLVLWPFIWLLSLPFRAVALSFDAVFALLRAILFLPARILGYRDNTARRPL
jgi:hypothetical protein